MTSSCKWPIAGCHLELESGHNKGSFDCIQLFRDRLSEKMHIPISKGIVGGFEFTVLQRII